MPKQAQRPVESVQRHAYTKHEAAASLGMSIDTFERRVMADIKIIRIGQIVLIRPTELERWTRENERYID
jgi:1,2-phenylacetyl-CoA epoxidase PaaB subunit